MGISQDDWYFAGSKPSNERPITSVSGVKPTYESPVFAVRDLSTIELPLSYPAIFSGSNTILEGKADLFQFAAPQWLGQGTGYMSTDAFVKMTSSHFHDNPEQ